MRIAPVGLIVLGLGLTGCAHTAMRGSVVMKGEDQEAHICLGDKEIKTGDRVDLYKNVCTQQRKGRGGDAPACQKVRLGSGTIERLLNEHYSVMRVDQGVEFEEGTTVEKI